MKQIIETPVLLIAFNRPDTTKVAFNAIREVKPKKLYVAIDGPRNQIQGEEELCKQVLQITQNVDWECDTQYLIREKNLGCKYGVSGAISWALENEDRVIIIEDDIVPAATFFSFAEELLEKYKDDERIAMISANQYTPIKMENDYLFTNYGHIWGWATWKRVWDNFDVDLPYMEDDIKNGYLKTMNFSRNKLKSFERYSKGMFNSIKRLNINTWDYQFVYFILRNNLLSIAPRVNLASNIGTSSSRIDTVAKINKNYYPADESFNLYKHPNKIECDMEYDEHHFKNHISISFTPPLYKRIYNKILRIIKSF